MTERRYELLEVSGQPVFEVVFNCKNCGDEWALSLGEKYRVDRSTGRVSAHRLECDELGVNKCDCCGHIRCPTCKLLDSVWVDDRSPIEEADDE